MSVATLQMTTNGFFQSSCPRRRHNDFLRALGFLRRGTTMASLPAANFRKMIAPSDLISQLQLQIRSLNKIREQEIMLYNTRRFRAVLRTVGRAEIEVVNAQERGETQPYNHELMQARFAIHLEQMYKKHQQTLRELDGQIGVAQTTLEAELDAVGKDWEIVIPTQMPMRTKKGYWKKILHSVRYSGLGKRRTKVRKSMSDEEWCIVGA